MLLQHLVNCICNVDALKLHVPIIVSVCCSALQQVSGQYTLRQLTFTDDYADPSSAAYQELAALVEDGVSGLRNILLNRHFNTEAVLNPKYL